MTQKFGYELEKIKEALEGSIVESVEKDGNSGNEGFIIKVRPFNVKNRYFGASLKVQYSREDRNVELIIIDKN